MKYAIIFLSFFLLSACSTTQEVGLAEKECGIGELMAGISCVEANYNKIEKEPLGSPGNPVRADGPGGQREYLSRLICTNGEPISEFRRAGSAGLSPYGFMSDIYLVLCDTHDGVVEHTIYMDMYHRGYIENDVASGFGSINKRM